MSDYDKLRNAVQWGLFDSSLTPEDVYDMKAMLDDDGPDVLLCDLMRAHVRFPARSDDRAADVLREICMQSGIKVRGSSYDEIAAYLANSYANILYILNGMK